MSGRMSIHQHNNAEAIVIVNAAWTAKRERQLGHLTHSSGIAGLIEDTSLLGLCHTSARVHHCITIKIITYLLLGQTQRSKLTLQAGVESPSPAASVIMVGLGIPPAGICSSS